MKQPENSVGRSTATPYKQENLKTLIDVQLYKTCCIFNKHQKHRWCNSTYYIFDMTAGDGDLKFETSPSIFLNALCSVPGLQFKAFFVEKNKKTYLELQKNINHYLHLFQEQEEKKYFQNNIYIIQGASEIKLKKFCNKKIGSWKYGVLYYDTNGFQQEPWNFMVDFAKKWNALDIILNFSPIQIKRNFGAFPQYTKKLPELINVIEKKYIYIRDDIKTKENKFKHIMLFCTNFGEYGNWKEANQFYDINSKEGKKIIKRHI